MKKTFKELTKNIDMVLFNNIIKVDYNLELESGVEYETYDGEEYFKDIYQYFVINWQAGEYLSKITGMPLYYSEKCDLFILGVDLSYEY